MATHSSSKHFICNAEFHQSRGFRRGSMAGRWVEFGHGGARWPAAGLSFVTAAGLSFVTAGLDLGRRLLRGY